MCDDTVRVAVRVKPLALTEIHRGCQNSVNIFAEENQLHIIGTDKAFTFNHVFEPTVDQEEFYTVAVKNMITHVFKGYNVTILAYGQTGSGKTHTMGTNYIEEESMGVIPRAVHDIFETIHSKNDWSFRVTVSFMELYQEQLYDLLASDKQRKDCIVDIREENKEIKIVGITEKKVNNADETLKLLSQGSLGRVTGATAMNNQSSRSHAIFTISIYQEKRDDASSATTAKFHLVDLAGSERSKKTGATGERFKEGVNINRGLLALGNVISQLGENNGNTFIAYRDSKLTRLLQDSLGGNSVTLMIACISPADYNLDETLSTLRYANRAKKIKNKPIVNQNSNTAEIARLNSIIRELKSSILEQGSMFVCPPEHADLIGKNKNLQMKLRQLTEKFNTRLINTMYMNECDELVENAKEQLYTNLAAISQEFSSFIKNESLSDYHCTILKNINEKIINLLDHQKKFDTEIINHISNSQNVFDLSKSENSSTSNAIIQVEVNENENVNSTIGLDEEHTEHTLRQAERENEVQTINRALAVKEKLISNLLNNVSEISNQTKEIQDMENEIKTLQAEKEQLIKTLENMQTNSASVKLAETRRKKLQELERKISELSKKCSEQNRIIKSKEKSDFQIKNLTTEIQSLKQTRVKLVREMRKEAEKFNQYKMMRERELHKLKDQDCKRQNQIIRMQNQHNKQQKVSKRKMEEACVIIKRLKETIGKKRHVQMKQDKSKRTKEEIKNWIAQGIAMVLDTVDGKCSLEKLMKDRATLTEDLDKLKKNYDTNPSLLLQNQIIDSSEYIELRNIQISDLQQKLIEAEDENRSNLPWEMIESSGDTKIAFETILEACIECKKKLNMKSYEYDELMDKYDQSLMNLRKYEIEEMTRNKNTIPEINIISQNNEMKKIQCGLKKDSRTDQQKENENPRVTEIFMEDVMALDFSDDSIVTEDDIEKDPDWRKTPLYKRLRSTIFKNTSDNLTEQIASKRISDGEVKCSCRTKCTSRICSCRKNTEQCSTTCGCKPDVCENRGNGNSTRPYFSEISHLEIGNNSSKRARTDNIT